MDLTPDDINTVQASVIGSMLIDDNCVGRVLQELTPEDFLTDAYRSIYLGIRSVFSAGRPVDLITLLGALQADPSVEWARLLRECMEITPTAANVGAYIPILQAQSRLARIKALGSQVATADTLDEAAELLDKIRAIQAGGSRLRITTMDQAVVRFLERQEKQTEPEYLRWGFSALNSRLHIGRGKFVVLGGYPSDGKTALALQMALAMSERRRVGFYSLETDEDTLTDRLIAGRANINMDGIKLRTLTSDDLVSVADASAVLSGRHLELITTGGLTVEDIGVSALSRRYDVIVVDYIQLLRPSTHRRSRYEEITDISMALHTYAQRTGVTVLGLSQLARPDRSSKARRAPRMSDLRESGQLEQDADAIMLLYREAPDDPTSRRVLVLEKNKEGETGQIYLRFDGSVQTFAPAASKDLPRPTSTRPREPGYQQVSFRDLPDNTPVPFNAGTEKTREENIP